MVKIRDKEGKYVLNVILIRKVTTSRNGARLMKRSMYFFFETQSWLFLLCYFHILNECLIELSSILKHKIMGGVKASETAKQSSWGNLLFSVLPKEATLSCVLI